MILTENHPAALEDRACELERMARTLREIARGQWPVPHEASHLEDWRLSYRRVDVLGGTRTASGKFCQSGLLLVLDEERGLAQCTHRTWSLGRKKENS